MNFQALVSKINEIYKSLIEHEETKNVQFDEMTIKVESLQGDINRQNFRISKILENLEQTKAENTELTMLMEEVLYSISKDEQLQTNYMPVTPDVHTDPADILSKADKLVKYN